MPEETKHSLLMRGLAFTLWCAGLFALAAASRTLCPANLLAVRHAADAARLPKGLEGLAVYKYDPARPDRPLYSLSIESLGGRDGTVGLFKSGLRREARINGLKLAIHQYSAASDASYPQPSAGFDLGSDFLTIAQDMMAALTGRKAFHPELNLHNIWQVSATDFDCRLFYDGQSSLSVSSALATISDKSGRLSLRGRVIITNSNGVTLQTNRLEWEPLAAVFTVQGVYVLDDGRVRSSGRDITLDHLLKPVSSEYSARGKEQKCFAVSLPQ